MAPVWARLCQLFIWADTRLCLSLEIILANIQAGYEGHGAACSHLCR